MMMMVICMVLSFASLLFMYPIAKRQEKEISLLNDSRGTVSGRRTQGRKWDGSYVAFK
jgi:hypothetical protein